MGNKRRRNVGGRSLTNVSSAESRSYLCLFRVALVDHQPAPYLGQTQRVIPTRATAPAVTRPRDLLSHRARRGTFEQSSPRHIGALAVLILFFALIPPCAAQQTSSQPTPPSSQPASDAQPAYKNPQLSVEQRVHDLLSRLTLEEKISQLGHTADAIPRLGIPEYNSALVCLAAAQTPQLPPGYPKAQYDESKVPAYTLPDPLVLQNGKKVKNTKTWIQKRRPELLKLFATNVYGRTMEGRPKEVTWEVTSPYTKALNGAAATKTVTLYFTGKKDGPKMELRITLPTPAEKPVRIFLAVGGDRYVEPLVSHGYGLATYTPASIQADSKDGYLKSIRAFYAQPGQKAPEPDEWGAIGAWAWGLSRAMDYLETDPDIDGRKVSLMGFSRFGKTAMWAGAQDQRFAIVFSAEAGCAGANLVRRQYGETVKLITTLYGFWFADSFKTYADRVDDLPVDFHELIALIAPRPVYIATAQEDYWGDPRGSFLAAKAAEPVYKLFGKAGLGVNEMPPLETPVGDTIGYHNRKGGHGVTEYDWQQFTAFADRHYGVPQPAIKK